MNIQITNDLAMRLEGFTHSEVLIPLAAILTIDILFPTRLFPSLRSNVITVSRAPVDKPMYVANCPVELIQLNCSENRPWQFVYQLAHELGHLADRSDLSFGQDERHCWIEEILCGAYSVYAMRQLSEIEGPLKAGAQEYLRTYIETTYNPSEVSHDWFATNYTEILTATGLTRTLQRLSGWLASSFPDGGFIADNHALINIPLSPDVKTYLTDWKARCLRPVSVPEMI